MVSYWYIIFVYESLPQGRNGGPKLQGSKIGDEEGRVAPLSLGDTVLQDRSWCQLSGWNLRLLVVTNVHSRNGDVRSIMIDSKTYEVLPPLWESVV